MEEAVQICVYLCYSQKQYNLKRLCFFRHRSNYTLNKVPWNIKRIVPRSTDTLWYQSMTRYEFHLLACVFDFLLVDIKQYTFPPQHRETFFWKLSLPLGGVLVWLCFKFILIQHLGMWIRCLFVFFLFVCFFLTGLSLLSEPTSVDLHVDGVSDICTKEEDINFVFTGFSVTGTVKIVKEFLLFYVKTPLFLPKSCCFKLPFFMSLMGY